MVYNYVVETNWSIPGRPGREHRAGHLKKVWSGTVAMIQVLSDLLHIIGIRDLITLETQQAASGGEWVALKNIFH